MATVNACLPKSGNSFPVCRPPQRERWTAGTGVSPMLRDKKLAALLGTTYGNIVINDMAVHQSSQQVFISVERDRADALPAMVEINYGAPELLDLGSRARAAVGSHHDPLDVVGEQREQTLSVAAADRREESFTVSILVSILMPMLPMPSTGISLNAIAWVAFGRARQVRVAPGRRRRRARWPS
jgi:hypothetical protein